MRPLNPTPAGNVTIAAWPKGGEAWRNGSCADGLSHRDPPSPLCGLCEMDRRMCFQGPGNLGPLRAPHSSSHLAPAGCQVRYPRGDGCAVRARGRGSADAHDLTAVRPSWTARRSEPGIIGQQMQTRTNRRASTTVEGVIPIQRGTQESRRAAFSPSSSINGRVRLKSSPRSRSTGADRGQACGVVNSPERRDGSMIGRAKAWEAAPPRQTFVPHFPFCPAKSFATCQRGRADARPDRRALAHVHGGDSPAVLLDSAEPGYLNLLAAHRPRQR